MTNRSLRPLMAPRSVAVIGATERPQHGSMAFRNLTRAGFAGKTYAVNPRYQTVFGHPCYPDLKSLPEIPDCAVLAIAATALPGLLREAGTLGLRAAVVFSAGFAEAGEAGRALQRELADIANQYGIALCGPNCMGIVNLADRTAMYTALVPPDLPRGRVGVVAQSGSVTYLLMSSHRIKCSYVVSSGNQANTDAADYLTHLVEDDGTDTIALFLEAVPRPDAFLGAVMRAHERGKPIVICKPGRSQRSAEALVAHTGTLAGSYEVFTAFCRQFGLIQVDDLDDMVETLVLLSGPRRQVSRASLGAINCSGGENALVMDLGEAVGIDLPEFSADTAATLRAVLPSFATVQNPLDVTGTFYYDGDGFRRCLEVVARDPNIGMVLSVLDLPAERVAPEAAVFNEPIVNATAAAAGQVDKPVVFLSNLSGEVHPDMSAILAKARVPILEGTRKGLQAIRHMFAWSSFGHALAAAGGTAALQAERARTLPPPDGLAAAIRAARGGQIGEYDAKQLLARFGLPIVREERARTADEAAAIAKKFRVPVVVKIDSPDLPHKTDVGGVILGVATPADAAAAFDRTSESVRHKASHAQIKGVLIAEMLRDGTELIIGMKRDSSFGPVVLLGLGGIFVEVLHAFTLRCAPFGIATARQMIAELPGHDILRGARGAEPRDVDALARFLVDFSRFAAASADLVREIDLNPVFVRPAGQGVVIADALMVI